MHLIKQSAIGPYPKFKKLVDFCVSLYEGQEPASRQVMLQNHTGEEDWKYGVGTIENYEGFPGTRAFTHIQPSLKDSVIAHYFKWLKIPVFRSRLMMLEPKSTYSIHRDHEFRFHLPLVTNKECFLLFPDNAFGAKMYHLPADGTTHWTNTRQPHTAMNCHQAFWRLHLVMCVDKTY